MGMFLLLVLFICLAVGTVACLVEMAIFGLLMRVLSRGQWKNFFLIFIMSCILVAAASIFVIATGDAPKEIGNPFSPTQWNAIYVLGLTPGIAGLFGFIALVDRRHESNSASKS